MDDGIIVSQDSLLSVSNVRVTFGCSKSKYSVKSSLDPSGRSAEPPVDCGKCIVDLNNQVAVFRDHVMRIGKSNDNPETRDQIREIRRKCVDLCETANEALMPQIRSDVAEGIPVDSQHLVNLVCCSQLLLRELRKSYFLITAHPMDMAAYYEKRPRSSGVAVLDRLVLWKPPHHDYHKEELQCINRDFERISSLLKEMKEYMPVETSGKGLIEENKAKMDAKRNRGLYRQLGEWCCMCKSNFG